MDLFSLQDLSHLKGGIPEDVFSYCDNEDMVGSLLSYETYGEIRERKKEKKRGYHGPPGMICGLLGGGFHPSPPTLQ